MIATTAPAVHTDATSDRPAVATGLVIWVERVSGYVAGHCKTFEAADDLAARCNAHVPGDPARVVWAPSLGAWLDR